MERQIKVLDKGFVYLESVYGSDSTILESARVSNSEVSDLIDTDYSLTERDYKLMSYLIKNRHTSPFEMVSLNFVIKMPIFVARQWIRHRTGRTNEVSSRYTVLTTEFYEPELSRIKGSHPFNKQSSEKEIEESIKVSFLEDLTSLNSKFDEFYKKYSNLGVANEIIRLPMPVNMYTKFKWQMDLNNLFKFLSLRNDPHSQYEMVEYAKVIESFLKVSFPVAYFYYKHHISEGSVVTKEFKSYTGY